MGGNALSQPGLRLVAEDYERVMRIVRGQLTWALPEAVRFHFIQSYKNKPSFGDMDVLVESYDYFDPAIFKYALCAEEMVRNGDVTSFGVKVEGHEGLFQVDIIKIAPAAFDFASKYFAFNDLGNLMGRIAHKQGFKYGHDGLWYVLRDPEDDTLVVKEILVTQEHKRALALMGYDPILYAIHERDGFYELEDVFKFVVTSPFFNKDIYLLENRNHTARVRDRKRKTYMAFLAWCADKSDLTAFDWSDKERLRKLFLDYAFAALPLFKEEVETALAKNQRRKEARLKYNGERVAELTGLSGKELGAFMADFKLPWFTDDHFWHWAYTVDQAEVDKAIMTAWEKRKGVDGK